jgi:hypothetical protein
MKNLLALIYIIKKKLSKILETFPIGTLNLPSTNQSIFQSIISKGVFWDFESLPLNFDFLLSFENSLDLSSFVFDSKKIELFFISLSSYFVKLHKNNYKLISQSLLDVLSSEFFLKLSTIFQEDEFIQSFSPIISKYTLIGTSSKKDTFFHLISSLKHLSSESVNMIIDLLSQTEC